MLKETPESLEMPVDKLDAIDTQLPARGAVHPPLLGLA